MRRTGAVAASRSPYIAELGPVPGYLSKDHLALDRFAADDARRLGLTLGMQEGAGWSGTGGPWIKPKHAYKNIGFQEIKRKGGEVFKWTKPNDDPETGRGFVGIVAYRTPAAETAGANPQRIAGADEKLVMRNCPKQIWSLYHSYGGGPIPHSQDIPADATVDSASIKDLTALIGTEGQLTWTVPDGDWTVLIATYGPGAGATMMALPSGCGLACDGLDPAALDCHWQNGILPVLNALGDHVGTTFRYIQRDSDETGLHNWGAIVPAFFRRLHGYDLLPWLPALTGRVVGDAERTERFMRDYRKALEVGWNEGFAKPMVDKCHALGLRYVVQPYSGGLLAFSRSERRRISCKPSAGWATIRLFVAGNRAGTVLRGITTNTTAAPTPLRLRLRTPQARTW